MSPKLTTDPQVARIWTNVLDPERVRLGYVPENWILSLRSYTCALTLIQIKQYNISTKIWFLPAASVTVRLLRGVYKAKWVYDSDILFKLYILWSGTHAWLLLWHIQLARPSKSASWKVPPTILLLTTHSLVTIWSMYKNHCSYM